MRKEPKDLTTRKGKKKKKKKPVREEMNRKQLQDRKKSNKLAIEIPSLSIKL